jgi:hypothetical protein
VIADWAAFAAAVERLALVRWIATADQVYPALSALHILSLALVVGPILVVDVRLLGGFRGADLTPALPVLTRIAALGVAAAIVTGALLASVQLTKYAANPAFLLKLALIAGAIANALAFRSMGSWGGRRRSAEGYVRARLHAALSLALWLGALFAGRWIAFVQ